MFRRLPGSLPADPCWEADLTKLGYFINEQGQIRQIKKPTERFQFRITDNDRFNEVHKEAFHKCLREEIYHRMQKLHIPMLFLPQVSRKTPDGPSIPIFTTCRDELKNKKSVVIIANDSMQDLGVWAYRRICDAGLDAGSCTGTVKALRQANEEEEPGIVIMNQGQYYYSHKENRALSHESWEALPRKSLFHPGIKASEEHNMVEGMRTKEDHVKTVFEKVINNEDFVGKDANLYVVGIGIGASALLKHLDEHWETLARRVKAAALVHPDMKPETLKPDFARFIETRTRSWHLSSAPAGSCIGLPSKNVKPAKTGPTLRSWEDEDDEIEEVFACPTFSSGETEHSESIFPKTQTDMFEFFAEAGRGGDAYVNPTFEVVKVERSTGPDSERYGGGLKLVDEHELDEENVLPAAGQAMEHMAEDLKKTKLEGES